MKNRDLSSILDPAIILPKMEGLTKAEVLRALTDSLLENGYIDNAEKFVADIYTREAKGLTGIGMGVSIPHGCSPAVKKPGIAIGRTEQPIPWESALSDDGWQETRLIFLFCVRADESFAENHQLLLSRLAGRLGVEARIVQLGRCETVREIMGAILCDDSELETVEAKEEIMELDLDL